MPDAPLPGLPAARPRAPAGVRGALELQLLGGACRAQGLFLTSSWGTTSPWLGVANDCTDWEVDRLEI